MQKEEADFMMATDEQHEQNTQADPTCYTIEQVAQHVGMTKRTLRYYEEVGLLPPADRTGGNYRRYCEEDIRLLQQIKELRDLLGFSLSDIRKLLDAESERGQIKLAYRQETDDSAKLAQLARADELIRGQIQLIEQKITALEQMRSSLLDRLAHHEQTRNKIYNSKKDA
jgi:MerR family transcriptional regulator, repressor of the yfmOP operon